MFVAIGIENTLVEAFAIISEYMYNSICTTNTLIGQVTV